MTASGDLDGDLLMLADQHRRSVAVVVDQRVMQGPVAGAGVQRDKREFVLLDEIGNYVRLPAEGCGNLAARDRLWLLV